MVIVKIIGGLGNQLFQYAFSKALENRTGFKVYHDVEDFSTDYKLRKISLQHFNVKINYADKDQSDQLKSAYNKALFKMHLISNGFLVKEKNLKYYAEQPYLFNEVAFSLNNGLYLNGYWQSEKYFSAIKDVIRSDFEILTPPSEGNLKFLDLIEGSNAVSLHIRRGDYISNPSANKIYNICSLSYYESAMNYIAERVTDPVFFVFSDDMEWVKNNLRSRFKIVLVDENDGESAYEDLRLMNKCQHNIIANSTFSWWGAWLNNNADKIVISPQSWFKEGTRSSNNLLPQEWITI